jgi:hypothetical protein
VADFHNLKRDEGPAALREHMRFTEDMIQRGEKNVLLLIDMRGVRFDKEMVNLVKAARRKTEALVDKVALVGMTGIQKVLIGIISKIGHQRTAVYDSLEEAEDWLTK